jgi:7-carboxy-7-deazaguanine synthase
MRIAEIFSSVQGEGRLTGTPTTFVRASGCNLRCWFCDTPYASWKPEGEDLSVREIVDRVAEFVLQHVVLTGGEPMLFAELIPLCEQLRGLDYHITIETAGTLFLPLECDLMSISPKLSNSTPRNNVTPQWQRRHDQTRHAPDTIRRLINSHDYQVKFVVDRREDLDEVDRYLNEFPEIDRGRVWLMPQGIDSNGLAEINAWLEPYCQQANLKFCPRMQVHWYGLMRGT